MKSEVLPELDLLYPTEEKRKAVKLRGLNLQNLPQDYVANMEVEKVAEILCRNNQNFASGLLQELCIDREVINYRLDIIDDFIKIPSLMPKLYKLIAKMLENDRKSIYDLNSPEPFEAVKANIDDLKSYVECIDDLHEFYTVKKENILSEGLKKLFGMFEKIFLSPEYKNLKECLAELSKALEDRIRSVTVAINFDEEMRPIATGIVSYSSEPYVKKQGLFDKLLYSKGAYSKNVVETKLHERYSRVGATPDDSIPNDIEIKLFKDLEKVTSKYMKKIAEALSEAKKLSFQDVLSLEAQLDFYSGEVNLIELAENKGVKMCRPEILPMESRSAEFKNVYDLCFFRKAIAKSLDARGDDLVVRNDLIMNNDARFFILTGANNGGKTTFTRAVGISQILAQAGLYVPADKCSISIVDYIYCHFPKEEEVGINTSRFTNEIKEFKVISDTITKNSLLMMNESIQSTTPKECLQIAEEIVRVFSIIGVRGIFATHLVDLAFKIDEINGDKDNKSKLESIIVCVDENTEKRLYKVVKGLPSMASHALSIFEEYGINVDRIRNRK